MTENLELDFRHRPPQTSVDEVEAVCAFLVGKGWIKARLIEEQIEIDDRRMRVLAEKSDGRILSSHKGYRLFDPATSIDDAERAANRLISQGRKMILRGVAIRRRFHRFSREKAPVA